MTSCTRPTCQPSTRPSSVRSTSRGTAHMESDANLSMMSANHNSNHIRINKLPLKSKRSTKGYLSSSRSSSKLLSQRVRWWSRPSQLQRRYASHSSNPTQMSWYITLMWAYRIGRRKWRSSRRRSPKINWTIPLPNQKCNTSTTTTTSLWGDWAASKAWPPTPTYWWDPRLREHHPTTSTATLSPMKGA